MEGPQSLIDSSSSRLAPIRSVLSESSTYPADRVPETDVGSDRKVRFVVYLFSDGPREYDFLLKILSLGRDRYWRRQVVKQASVEQGGFVLDIACGTGLLSYEFASNGVRVVGVDVTREMLEQAKKIGKAKYCKVVDYVLARAENLPFRESSFDSATISLATRNVSDAASTFREMGRCVKSGRKVVSMDFTRPSGWFFSPFYDFYISKILPALGVVISMHWNEIFVYLAASIRRSRSPEQIAALMYSVGLRDIFLKRMTHGTTAFVSGEKAATQERASVEVTSPG